MRAAWGHCNPSQSCCSADPLSAQHAPRPEPTPGKGASAPAHQCAQTHLLPPHSCGCSQVRTVPCVSTRYTDRRGSACARAHTHTHTGALLHTPPGTCTHTHTQVYVCTEQERRPVLPAWCAVLGCASGLVPGLLRVGPQGRLLHAALWPGPLTPPEGQHFHQMASGSPGVSKTWARGLQGWGWGGRVHPHFWCPHVTLPEAA